MAEVKLRRGFKADAERKSEGYRKILGLDTVSPLCGYALAEHLNIPVFSPLEIGLPKEKADSLMAEDSGWSAVCVKGQSGRFGIVHNILHSPARQQSNIMHELAHIILEHETMKHEVNVPDFMRQHDPIHEKEALELGACLQIPRVGLLKKLKQGVSKEEIATFFGASPQMVNFRIGTTGVMKQLSYSKKF